MFSARPSKEHWGSVKHILRYLEGTADYGLLFNLKDMGECVGYSDTDWAGDLGDKKSTPGCAFSMSGATISWRSKKQSCVALSTAEAEYIALAGAAQETLWLQQLLADMGHASVKPMLIHEDNQTAITMTKNPQFHRHAKHISIKYHFIRDQVEEGTVALKYCPSGEMIADILTKGLSYDQLHHLHDMIGLEKLAQS